ncbi:unnamed protein product [Heligmosomoides polygyrus]|uniref:Transposase n=1 Tax=Heligmosomoides polygyrus TaxID=6339 RepID=A0A183G7C9_HELPZ|nr:unnamed protein product [Heligmosomoides polygyrus]
MRSASTPKKCPTDQGWTKHEFFTISAMLTKKSGENPWGSTPTPRNAATAGIGLSTLEKLRLNYGVKGARFPIFSMLAVKSD